MMNDGQTRGVLDQLSRIENGQAEQLAATNMLSRKLDERLSPLEKFQVKVGVIASLVGGGAGILLYSLLGWLLSS